MNTFFKSNQIIISQRCELQILFSQYRLETGLCISRPRAFCLIPDPSPGSRPPALAPNVFTGPGPQFIFTSPGPQFVFTGPGPQFVYTGPGPQFVFTGPGLQFLLSVQSMSLHIPTLSPQFAFTGPGLRFLLPMRDLNLHLPFYW